MRRMIPQPHHMKIAANPGGKDAIILVNGILSSRDWQTAACNWGNANTSLAWSFYYYSADALLTGLWQSQHADGLYGAVSAARASGARRVHVVTHSNGAAVAALCLQRHKDCRIDTLIDLAAADYRSFKSGWWKNGLNDLIGFGQVWRVILGVSINDGVLGSPLQWLTPWFWDKTLGKDGPTDVLAPVGVGQFENIPFINTPVVVGQSDAQSHTSWVDGWLGGFNLPVFSIIAQVLTGVEPAPQQPLGTPSIAPSATSITGGPA